MFTNGNSCEDKKSLIANDIINFSPWLEMANIHEFDRKSGHLHGLDAQADLFSELCFVKKKKKILVMSRRRRI